MYEPGTERLLHLIRKQRVGFTFQSPSFMLQKVFIRLILPSIMIKEDVLLLLSLHIQREQDIKKH